MMYSKNDFFPNYLEYLGGSRVDNNWFGGHGHVPKSENHENERFSGCPKVKSNIYKSEMKQNNYTELLGHSFLTIYNANGPQTPTPTKP